MSNDEKQKSAIAQPQTRPEFWIATLSTRHYEWMGVGMTEQEAKEAMKARFFKLNSLTEAEWLEAEGAGDWFEFWDPRTQKVRPGEGYVDGEDTDDYAKRHTVPS